jgi:hypothetical protein
MDAMDSFIYSLLVGPALHDLLPKWDRGDPCQCWIWRRTSLRAFHDWLGNRIDLGANRRPIRTRANHDVQHQVLSLASRELECFDLFPSHVHPAIRGCNRCLEPRDPASPGRCGYRRQDRLHCGVTACEIRTNFRGVSRIAEPVRRQQLY